MKNKLSIVIISIILAIVIIISWTMLVSPQYSLKQLKKGSSRNEVIVFDKYVDLDSTIDSAIEQIWQYYSNQPTEDQKNSWVDLRNEIGHSLLSLVKPNLKEIAKREVYNYVIQGEFGSTDSKRDSKLTSLIAGIITEKINPKNWEFQTINYAKIRGGFAFLGLTYYDKSKQANFLVEVRMRNMSRYWQIVEILNISQIMNIFLNINNN